MPEFFRVVTPARVFDALEQFERLQSGRVALDDALGRVAAEAVLSKEDIPAGPRSTMDGFAVRAADTFGASDSIPALLERAGAVSMGALPDFSVARGQAADIPTGGFLPDGADAVAMIEHTRDIGGGAIEVYRPVTAGENVLGRAEDIAAGAVALPAGRRLRPHDIGLLAGLGATELSVYRRPRVAVISTGDEIVPIGDTPAPGLIRDMNTHAISALVRDAGAEPVTFDIVPDEPAALRAALQAALEAADVVALSGGSSVGARDYMLDVVAALPGATVHAHGVAVKPGKPTLIADVGGKAVFGLPGHPVSALIVARIFLVPFLNYLEGEPLRREPAGTRVSATLAVSVPSAHGMEEYVRVSLEQKDGVAMAQPVFGKSGMIATLVNADGFIVIPMHAEGVPGGELVDVFLF